MPGRSELWQTRRDEVLANPTAMLRRAGVVFRCFLFLLMNLVVSINFRLVPKPGGCASATRIGL